MVKRRIVCAFLILCMVLGVTSVAFATLPNADDILRATGMTQAEIDAIDDDIKLYIVSTLPENAVYERGTITETGMTDELIETPSALPTSSIVLTCPVFRDSVTGVYSLYPTFEITEAVKTDGDDTFAFAVGAGMSVVTDSLSGTVWYKTTASSSWQTNWPDVGPYSYQNAYGYAINGNIWRTQTTVYSKGCCSFRATKDSTGATTKVMLGYCHNKAQGWSYDTVVSAGSVLFTGSTPANVTKAYKLIDF